MDNNMNPPAVSVIMAVFNGELHLEEAIESILAQTFSEFEFIIVDDASTDNTPRILRRYAIEDNRVTILTNATNQERSISRNAAIMHAQSAFIAVMDADDVAMPDRLAKQLAFMLANPDVVVCGGAISIYDAPDEIWLPPTEHEAIRAQLLFESCIYHPTVMYRKEQICASVGGYDTSMPPTEDYDLWARLSMNPAARFANLPDILCRYRYNGKDEKYKAVQQHKANLVRKKLLRSIGLTPSDKEFAAHLGLSLWNNTLSFSDLWACKKWLGKLSAAALNAEPAYERVTLERELQRRWLALCENNLAASAYGLIYFCSGFAEFSLCRLLSFARKITP
jgi:glycosyltransferase involved in cell wall biosynthesis